MKIKMIDSMYGREGKKVRLLCDDKEISRRVYYRSYCGLFIIVKGYLVFEYETRFDEEIYINKEV